MQAMEIIDGQKLSEELLHKLKNKISEQNLKPRLDIIFIGSNFASEVYITKKINAGKQIGVEVVLHKFESITDTELITLLNKLSKNPLVNAVIIQLPAPNIDIQEMFKLIDVQKDVDGLNPLSLGSLWKTPNQLLQPATAKAVEYVLKYIAEQQELTLPELLTGKTVMILNRSDIIGKPLAAILTNLNGTVILAHSKTKDIDSLLKISDIIISGTGVTNLVTGDTIKTGAIVIDVGYKKEKEIEIGDVDQASVAHKASWLSPAPGGVGPIGVAMLLQNVVEATIAQSAHSILR